MGSQNKKRLGVGRRVGSGIKVEEEQLEDLVGVAEAQEMREMSDALDSIIDNVTNHMRELREAGIRNPDPDDSVPDDEDTLRPGWDD
ncbi:MAG: hypothetical protein COB05_00955 [Marinobacter sp.]|nr:MAG: hypothetical protein COB05_00955 [Marinobacter sp.]